MTGGKSGSRSAALKCECFDAHDSTLIEDALHRAFFFVLMTDGGIADPRQKTGREGSENELATLLDYFDERIVRHFGFPFRLRVERYRRFAIFLPHSDQSVVPKQESNDA